MDKPIEEGFCPICPDWDIDPKCQRIHRRATPFYACKHGTPGGCTPCNNPERPLLSPLQEHTRDVLIAKHDRSGR